MAEFPEHAALGLAEFERELDELFGVSYETIFCKCGCFSFKLPKHLEAKESQKDLLSSFSKKKWGDIITWKVKKSLSEVLRNTFGGFKLTIPPNVYFSLFGGTGVHDCYTRYF